MGCEGVFWEETMIASGLNLVMTVIGFAVSTMFILFLCTRLICARIQLSAARRSFPVAARSDLSLLERGLHGLEPAMVANFPTKKFSDEFFSSGEDTQCTVCLAEYQEKDILRILPYCGHAFHITCIDIWLQHHTTCPICRISLRNSPERKCVMAPMFSAAVRSAYSPDALNSNSHHCLHTGDEYPSRMAGNQPMGPIEENPFASDHDAIDAREIVSTLMDGNNVAKANSDSKQVESPSNL